MFYDPTLGRFLQPDTLVPDPASSEAYDRYAYVNNNPINYVDPSGHMPKGECGNHGEDCGNNSPADQYRDYIYNEVHNDIERTKNSRTAGTIIFGGTELALTIIAPPVGLLYQVVNDKKITGMDVAFGLIPFGIIGDLGKGIGYVDDLALTSKGFKNFAEFKRVIGSAGVGKQWHHIVEQFQVSKSGFSEQLINSTDNILAIDKATHQKISGLYSSIQPYSEGLRVRDWLAGKSFEEQYNFGVRILKDFGILK